MAAIHSRSASLGFKGPLPDILCELQSTLPIRPNILIAEYAGEELSGQITKQHCPGLNTLMIKISQLSKAGLTYLHQNLCQLDARDLYDAMKWCRFYYQNIDEDDALKEGFGLCYRRIDMALSKKCYKAIIKSLLFSYVGDDKQEAEIFSRAREDIMKDAIMSGRSKKPIEMRIQFAATYQFKPHDSTSSYYVLPTIPYPDVAALEISFVTDQSLKDLALKIWSITVIPGFDKHLNSMGYRVKYNADIISMMGVQQKKTFAKRITMRQNAVSKINLDPGEINAVMSLSRQESFGSMSVAELYSNPEEYLKTKNQKIATQILLQIPFLKKVNESILSTIAEYAYKAEDDEAVRVYLANKSNEKPHVIEKTPADWSTLNRLSAVKACLKAGANAHPSLLFRCASVPIAEALIQSLPDINEPDAHGNTPLHDAVAYDRAHVVDLMLKYKADVNLSNLTGCTPLHKSISKIKGFDITNKLLDARASVIVPDSLNQTPLDYALKLAELIKNSKRKDNPSELVKDRMLKDLIERMEQMKEEEIKLNPITPRFTPRQTPRQIVIHTMPPYSARRRLSHSTSPPTHQQLSPPESFHSILQRPASGSSNASRAIPSPSQSSMMPLSRISQTHSGHIEQPANRPLQVPSPQELTLPPGTITDSESLGVRVITIHTRTPSPARVQSQPTESAESEPPLPRPRLPQPTRWQCICDVALKIITCSCCCSSSDQNQVKRMKDEG
jgi:hypothetical protein